MSQILPNFKVIILSFLIRDQTNMSTAYPDQHDHRRRYHCQTIGFKNWLAVKTEIPNCVGKVHESIMYMLRMLDVMMMMVVVMVMIMMIYI